MNSFETDQHGPHPDELPPLWRLFWLVAIAGHLAAAIAWLALMPGGFPVDHPRFWANRVAPITVIGWSVAAVWAARRGRIARLRLLLTAFPVAWAAAAIAGRWIFPISSSRFWLGPLAVALLMAVGSWLPIRDRSPLRWRSLLAVGLLAGAAGVFAVWSQRAPAPDTRPVGELTTIDLGPPSEVLDAEPDPGRLSDRLRVTIGDGAVVARVGGLDVEVRPLLEFFDRSPDRCWTILSPPDRREGPPLVLEGLRLGQGRLELGYRRDGPMTLRVEDGRAIRIEATAELPWPVYSHLNTFCDLHVRGHDRLSVAFSPCPDVRIEVRPADYPTGRPLRVGFLGDDGVFRVVEASSGEKGPFRTLAAGPLRRGEPLVIALYDGDRPAVRVDLLDWSAQAGVQRSPSAGWGLPVNAIEFLLEGDAPGSPAAFFVTLAGTSVGRGWDSVGHRDGGYRNRVRVTPAAGEPEPPAPGK